MASPSASASASAPAPGTRWRGPVVTVVAVVALVSVASLFIEWVEEPVDYGYGDDARRDPHLAAKQYLKASGHPVESVRGLGLLDALPPPTDLIVMSASRYALSARRVEGLRNWVYAGGHLIVVAEDFYDWEEERNPDALLEAFGFYLDHCATEEESEDIEGESTAADGATDSEDTEVANEATEGSSESETDLVLGELLREGFSGELPECWEGEGSQTTIFLDDGDTAAAEFYGCPVVVDSNEVVEAEGDLTGYVLYGDDFGEGKFVAATSLQIFENERIHCAEHAYLLGAFAIGRGKTWLLADPAVPGIASLAWAIAPASWLGAAVWIVLWAAARSLPIGVAPREAPTARRALEEHLDASADFYWRMGFAASSLAPLRTDILRRARLQYPAIESLAIDEQARWLSNYCGLPVERIGRALTHDPGDRRAEWVEIVQSLDELRRHL